MLVNGKPLRPPVTQYMFQGTLLTEMLVCGSSSKKHEPCSLSSLANDKFSDWSKLKAFADNKINVNVSNNLVWEG